MLDVVHVRRRLGEFHVWMRARVCVCRARLTILGGGGHFLVVVTFKPTLNVQTFKRQNSVLKFWQLIGSPLPAGGALPWYNQHNVCVSVEKTKILLIRN